MKRRSFLTTLSKAGLITVAPVAAMASNNGTTVETDAITHQFTSPPSLQNMDFDGVTVMWISAKKSFSWLEVEAENGKTRKLFAQKNGLISANNRINKIRITGLAPGTSYKYTVFSKEIVDFQAYKMTYGETIKSGPHVFTTPVRKADEVRFVLFNDLHDHPATIPEFLGKFAKERDYDFVVFNGDAFDYVNDEKRIVTDLLTPVCNTFASNVPFLMIQGNHEVRGSFSRQLFDYFDYPTGNCYYAFTRGPIRFVVLDSGEDKLDADVEYSGLVAFDPYREEQAEWLKEEINSKEFRKAAFRVVLIHIPVFYSGDWHGTMHCRELFNPLFNRGKIDLAISGHTHRYGTFPADPATHNYPIMIGGGPVKKRTFIKAKATARQLKIEMLTDDGKVVGEFDLRK